MIQLAIQASVTVVEDNIQIQPDSSWGNVPGATDEAGLAQGRFGVGGKRVYRMAVTAGHQ